MVSEQHEIALLDKFFPWTGRAWRPLTWLEIGAGLSLWQFTAEYYRETHTIEVRFQVLVPSSTPGVMGLQAIGRSHAWELYELASGGAEYIKMVVCEAARNFGHHEVMESLKIGGQHYFADALARDHGEGRDA